MWEAGGWELLFPRALSILLAASCPACFAEGHFGAQGSSITRSGELGPRSEPHLSTSLLLGAQHGDVPGCWGQWLG